MAAILRVRINRRTMFPAMEGRDAGCSSTLRDLAEHTNQRIARALAPLIAQSPQSVPAWLKLLERFQESGRQRQEAARSGLQVPPFMILSVTAVCNLRCSGCFAVAAGTVGKRTDALLNADAWKQVIQQARHLGVFGFVIAGGEPFLMPGLAALLGEFPDCLFLVFTNGTKITDADYQLLHGLSNVIVVLSVEGDRAATDRRRGPGVHDRVMEASRRLRETGILTGFSTTVTCETAGFWSSAESMRTFTEAGSGLLALIEHIPVGAGDEDLALSPEQRKKLRAAVVAYRSENAAYVVHSPDDEEAAGGCVSAGRGFAHVTPLGDVTPCPVSNWATHNLRSSTLEAALGSEMFTRIRANEALLETDGHPCALQAHPRELSALLSGLGAYRTGQTQPSLTPLAGFGS
jgi:MoaA/NifB/PqqE/SkfB family radical SAM enzyme